MSRGIITWMMPSGMRIWSEPRGLAAGYRWPQFSIHRGQLLGLLHRTVLDRLGPGSVHPGHHLSHRPTPGTVRPLTVPA